ncbi:dihydrofolate reductase [Oribacterium sinus]|uniref:Dihydrofolate reductase n=1 Tax=Oribacterium sinus F0268 TaxID=585501 RepID=C2KUX7_9FIRM|nr:dihydrofolate reductase [Oribacterium sinus]EEJ52424.1 dihydrofolate reductase [Oribacterium sinus F0268]
MISIIVAVAKGGAIGKEGKMPWKIPGEQRQFKDLTTGHVVIMGRTSYEEIGHPLPERTNIVVSKTKVFSGENLYTVKSLQEAIERAGQEEIFIAGGAEIFQEALPLADKIYMTYVDMEVPDADRFFPDFPEEEYTREELEKVGGETSYLRVLYTKKV